nr:FAD-dependent monooxygenase [Aurantimonas aggregata]
MNRGISADIIDWRSDWRTPGFGLFLPGNASRAFGQLGLMPLIMQSAVPIVRQDFLDFRGRLLSRIDAAAFWAGCGPCLSLPRAEMHAILRESIETLPIRTGVTFSDLRQTSGGCVVTFDDQSTATYDLVVGADGLNSTVRRLAVDPAPPSYTGDACWRFFVPNMIGISSWTVMLAKGRSLLVIPVDRSTLYVNAGIAHPSGDFSDFGAAADLQKIFADFGVPLRPLLDRLPPATEMHFSRIESVQPQTTVSGRVVLIGDAAHAMSPSMAEGAGLACEDAVLLADAVTGTHDLDAALEAYAPRRQSRVAWVQKQSQTRDRIRWLPLALSGGLLRFAGGSLYRRSYEPLLIEA